jgi:hypothetical protein
MKKVFSLICVLAVCATALAQGQPKGNEKKTDGNDWRERVRAAQVAFLTNELDLTEAEAQSFWPVYNDVQKQRRQAFEAQQKAFMALQKGIDGNDVNKLLQEYVAASKKLNAIEEGAADRYKKVLPVQKVAKLLLAEEKFRHQQIGRLGQGGMPFGPQGGPQGNPPYPGTYPGQNRGGNAPAQKQDSSI